jgi:hypothetical protein
MRCLLKLVFAADFRSDGPYDRAVQYTKSDLTKHMAIYLPYVHEEISKFFDKNITSNHGWPLSSLLSKITLLT